MEVNITDTNDTIICIKALNSQQFAIYKDASQWIGIGAGGIFPFIFELRDRQPGPASPYAVVQAEGVHYYLGQDGDIYRFDGTRCTSVGGNVKRSIQTSLSSDNQIRVHGLYDRTNREIWWFWPLTSGTRAVVLRLPYNDVPLAASAIHVFSATLPASAEWKALNQVTWDGLATYTWNNVGATYPTWDSFFGTSTQGMVAFDSLGQAYNFGRVTGDAGASFDAYWVNPYRAIAGPGHNVRVDAIDAFFKQTSAATSVDIILVTTDTLADAGTQQTAQAVDISVNGRHRATYYDNQSRFMSIRHRLLGVTGLQEYRGGVLYAYSRGES